MTQVPWRWSAPETIESGGETMDTRSDVFMLGVAFWEMTCFTSLPVHHYSEPKQLKAAYKSGKAPRHRPLTLTQTFVQPRDAGKVPLVVPPRVPAVWRDLILSICRIDPEERPTTAEILGKWSKRLSEREDPSSTRSLDKLNSIDVTAPTGDFSVIDLINSGGGRSDGREGRRWVRRGVRRRIDHLR